MISYPQVLVISNNSFSKSNSNGRTLGGLFTGWPQDKLAQFCISTDFPDYNVCNNYYCVSDFAALKATISLKPAVRNDLKSIELISSSLIPANRIKRTSIKSIIRHVVWTIGAWKGKSFYRWIDNINPQIVVIQSGDTAFTHNIAIDIAKRYNAKLVFFNTEGIYFLRKNFLYKGFLDAIFFPIYKKIYNHAYERAMKYASYAVYLNDSLKVDNDALFHVPSIVIHNSSSLSPSNLSFNSESPKFTYLGNFGFDRFKALADVADVLQELNDSYYLDVYGKASSNIEDFFKTTKGIRFHGYVSYEKVVDIIMHSEILIHAESQNETSQESLKYGFSTKIADCLSCGRPFVLYAAPELACSIYLRKTGAGWYVGSRNELRTTIRTILDNEKVRNENIKKSLQVAANNHSIKKNSARFQKLLLSITTECEK